MNRSGYLDIMYDDTYTDADVASSNGFIRAVLPPNAAGTIATKGVNVVKLSTWNRRTSFAKLATAGVDAEYDVDFSTGTLATPVAETPITVRITQYTNGSDAQTVTSYTYLTKDGDVWTNVADALATAIDANATLTATNTGAALHIEGAPFSAILVNGNNLAFTATAVGKFSNGTSTEIQSQYINDPLNTMSFVSGHSYDIISIDCADATDSLYDEGVEYKKVRFIIDSTAANGQDITTAILGYLSGINSL
jgi:hypothetical protein